MKFLTVRHALAVSSVTGTLLLTGPAVPSVRGSAAAAAVVLSHTVHPPVARDASRLWMAPSASDRTTAAANPALVHLQAALRLYAEEKYEQALSRFSAAATPKSPLRAHAAYYAGVSELRLRRFEAARERFAELKNTPGFVGEAAALGEAEAAHALGDFDAAAKIYRRHPGRRSRRRCAGHLAEPRERRARRRRCQARGRRRTCTCITNFHSASTLHRQKVRCKRCPRCSRSLPETRATSSRWGGASGCSAAGATPDARTSFLRLKPHASDDDAELVSLRLAEIEYFQGRYSNAREALRPFLTSGARQAEARFFYLMSQRGLRNDDMFEQLVRALEQDFPESTWAEEALNHLATFYIQRDRDDEADAVLREMYARFPRGRYAERAAWKAGWASYRKGDMSEAARYFESAAASFPRSDYRPAWLYWSGRARAAMGDTPGAVARYQLTSPTITTRTTAASPKTLCRNRERRSAPSRLVFAPCAAPLGGEDGTFRRPKRRSARCLRPGLYEPAVKELEFARAKWGDSPGITATIAWANKQMAASESGTAQFALARGSITLMKRAYPQFMASGGEQLPREILTTIFPLQLLGSDQEERGRSTSSIRISWPR